MRMTTLYDVQAVKRPVNLNVNSDVLAKARAEGLNLSAIAEAAIAAELARRARERWDAEVAEACAAHGRYLDEYGSLTDLVLAQQEADAAG
jgi:antitoxin CcdA